MGVFTDDMIRLSEEIAAGRASRKEMIKNLKGSMATLKTDVSDMLFEFGENRIRTKQKMQSDLSEFTSRLHHFAEDLGEQVIDMRKGFHQERTEMLGRMNSNLEHFMASLKDEVSQMQTRFKRQRAESSRQIRTEMDDFLAQLKSFTQNLEEEVCDMKSRFGSDRIQMKQHMDEDLKDFMDRLRSFAVDLDDDVAQMRKGFQQARSEMIARLQLELGGFTDGLKTSVGSMLDQMRSDRMGGWNAWKGTDHAPEQPVAPKPSQTAAKKRRDDLTRIPGIGAKRQTLLNRAGIHSFSQLARSTPGQLKQMLGKQSRLIDVEKLIAHAKTLDS